MAKLTWGIIAENPRVKRLALGSKWIVAVEETQEVAASTFVMDAPDVVVDVEEEEVEEDTDEEDEGDIDEDLDDDEEVIEEEEEEEEEEETPPPPLLLPPSGRVIGTNLMPHNDWDVTFPFEDLLSRARGWIVVDAEGRWGPEGGSRIPSFGPRESAVMVLFTNPGPRPSKLQIYTRGVGSFRMGFGRINDWIDVYQDNHVSIVDVPQVRTVFIEVLSFSADNPLEFLHIFDVEKKNEDFDAITDQYSCLRFMDWQRTNLLRTTSMLESDFDLNKTSHFQDGVPLWECVGSLHADQDAWFCIPVNADDDYVRRFIEEVATQALPQSTRRIFIEFSNEFWNGMFPQSRHFSSDWNENMRQCVLRCGRLAQLVNDYNDGGAKRIFSVMGMQAANPWWIGEAARILLTYGLPLPDFTAVAPYFGHDLPDDPAIFDDGRIDVAIDVAIAQAVGCKSMAASHGMRLAIYECGQHITQGGGVTVNRDPRMGAAYEKYFTRLLDVVDSDAPVCHYALASSYGQHGSWGEAEHQDEIGRTPKSLALSRWKRG